MKIDRSAVIHYPSIPFVYPVDDNTYEFLLYTGKEVENAWLEAGDTYIGGVINDEEGWTPKLIVMEPAGVLAYQKVWKARYKPPFKRTMYRFRLQSDEESLYLFQNRLMDEEQMKRKGRRLQYFNCPWLFGRNVPRFPKWIDNTLWYQIFPDRFCRQKQDEEQDKRDGLEDWNAIPATSGFYGGTLKGIQSRLDHLQSLGVDGIYLNPIFLSPSSHKYDTTDYLQIDPAFGTEQDFTDLVQDLHARGMKIMLDGVFNHVSTDFFAWKDVLEHREQSRYKDWFMIKDYSFDETDDQAPMKDQYYSFGFVSSMPKLNTAHPDVQAYLIGVMEHWVKDWNIDGIRFDAADDLALSFCDNVRSTLKAIRPNLYLLAEIWHDAMPWLEGNRFDGIMNYPFVTSLDDFFAENEKAEILEQELDRILNRYPSPAVACSYNPLDSHDTERMIHKLSGNLDTYWQLMLLEFCMPGAHALYYGDEIALSGADDPDNRRPMPWNEIDEGKYDERLAMTKAIISLSKEHPLLSEGRFVWISHDNRIMDFIKENDEEALRVVLNFSDQPWPLLKEEPDLAKAKILLENQMEQNELLPGGFAVLSLA